MNNFEGQPVKMVKVYLRNQQKIAKIVLFPESVQANQLFQTASVSYNIPAQNIHLFYGGKVIEKQSLLNLYDNTIIHVVNLQHLKCQELVLIIKQIEGKAKEVTFRTSINMKVKDFIDEKLAPNLGFRSDQFFLVHMGRQLNLQKTFKEQQVETNCQLLCVKFQQQPQNTREKIIKNVTGNDENQVIIISPKQNDKASQHQSKDIYPTHNFTIDVPTELEVDSTNNHLNLIFDSNIRRSSSIRGINFAPDQTIAEEDDFSLADKHSYMSQSEHMTRKKSSVSHYSQHGNDTSKDNSIQHQINNLKRSRKDEKKSRAHAEETIKIEEPKQENKVSQQKTNLLAKCED